MVVCPACAWSLGSIDELVQQRVDTRRRRLFIPRSRGTWTILSGFCKHMRQRSKREYVSGDCVASRNAGKVQSFLLAFPLMSCQVEET